MSVRACVHVNYKKNHFYNYAVLVMKHNVRAWGSIERGAMGLDACSHDQVYTPTCSCNSMRLPRALLTVLLICTASSSLQHQPSTFCLGRPSALNLRRSFSTRHLFAAAVLGREFETVWTGAQEHLTDLHPICYLIAGQ